MKYYTIEECESIVSDFNIYDKYLIKSLIKSFANVTLDLFIKYNSKVTEIDEIFSILKINKDNLKNITVGDLCVKLDNYLKINLRNHSKTYEIALILSDTMALFVNYLCLDHKQNIVDEIYRKIFIINNFTRIKIKDYLDTLDELQNNVNSTSQDWIRKGLINPDKDIGSTMINYWQIDYAESKARTYKYNTYFNEFQKANINNALKVLDHVIIKPLKNVALTQDTDDIDIIKKFEINITRRKNTYENTTQNIERVR